MEKNSNKINSNSTNKYSDQSPAEGIKNNYYVKNSVIIRSRYSKPDKTNKNMREKKICNELEDNLDHPQPLISDIEGSDDIRESLLLNELRTNKKNKKKENEKEKNSNNILHQKYFNFIKKTVINSNNNNNDNNKEIRVNLNEININNKLKKKLKEVKKDNEPNINAHLSYNQNPFRLQDNLNKKNTKQVSKKNNVNKINEKKVSELCKRIKKPTIKKNDYNKINNQITNNKTSKANNSKENNYFILSKEKLNINDKNINQNSEIYASINTLATQNENENILNKPIQKTITDFNNTETSPQINQIFVSQNSLNYKIHPKNKKISNVSNKTTSDEEFCQKRCSTLTNSTENIEGIKRETFSRGGKFNNIQTTFVIFSKKSSNNIQRQSGNLNSNLVSNLKTKSLTLKQMKSLSNLKSNAINTPLHMNNNLSTISGTNIHICENKPSKNSILNKNYNNKKIKYSLLKEKPSNLPHNSNISYQNLIYNNNYYYNNTYNIRNIKLKNSGMIFDNNYPQYFNTTNSQVYNENAFHYILYDNRNSSIPYKDNYQYYIYN